MVNGVNSNPSFGLPGIDARTMNNRPINSALRANISNASEASALMAKISANADRSVSPVSRDLTIDMGMVI